MKKIFGLFLIIILGIFLVSCTAPQVESDEQKAEEKAAVQTKEPEVTEESEAVEEPAANQVEQPVKDGDDKVAAYSKIKQSEAKKLMDEQNPIVLDVREDYEYEEKHIPGATLLPLGSIENKISEVTEDKDALILVYCRSGNRSRTATEILVTLGYTNVHDFGGIIDWAYDVER